VALLLAFNAQYLRAALHSDLAWFERHLAGDFLCSLPDGTLVDRPAFLERLRAPSRLSELDAHEVVVRLLGPGERGPPRTGAVHRHLGPAGRAMAGGRRARDALLRCSICTGRSEA